MLTVVTGTWTYFAEPAPPAGPSTSFTAGAVPGTDGSPFSSSGGASPYPTRSRSLSWYARSSASTRRGFSGVSTTPGSTAWSYAHVAVQYSGISS